MPGNCTMTASLARTGVLGVVLMAMAATAMGCKSAPTVGGAQLEVLGPGATTAASAAELRAEGASTVIMESWGGEVGNRLEIAREAPDGNGRYMQRRWMIEGDKRSLAREQHLRTREDGAVVLEEEINHAESVEVVFEPPLIVVPAEFAALEGELPGQKVQMKVHPIGNRKRVRASGTVVQSISVGPPVRVRTPAGEFEAWPLKSVFAADLGASKVNNESDLWLSAGIGIIAEQRRERTTVLGLQIRDNRESWVIVENFR